MKQFCYQTDVTVDVDEIDANQVIPLLLIFLDLVCVGISIPNFHPFFRQRETLDGRGLHYGMASAQFCRFVVKFITL